MIIGDGETLSTNSVQEQDEPIHVEMISTMGEDNDVDISGRAQEENVEPSLSTLNAQNELTRIDIINIVELGSDSDTSNEEAGDDIGDLETEDDDNTEGEIDDGGSGGEFPVQDDQVVYGVAVQTPPTDYSVTCPHCYMVFPNTSRKSIHMENHEPRKFCPFVDCSSTFGRKDNLAKHIKKYHN